MEHKTRTEGNHIQEEHKGTGKAAGTSGQLSACYFLQAVTVGLRGWAALLMMMMVLYSIRVSGKQV